MSRQHTRIGEAAAQACGAKRRSDAPACDCGRVLKAFQVDWLSLCDAWCDNAVVVPPRAHARAIVCLTVEGGYELDWCNTRVRCPPASLVFHPAGQVYGVRISDLGSRCLTLGIDPAAAFGAADILPALERLGPARRAAPHWLAFQLRSELELGDDLSPSAIANSVHALVAELGGRPALEARSTPPSWLKRVQEQIDDEFQLHHTLESLAATAGVHHVHLAREFRRRFGCTVGHFIRQRRVEVACNRLMSSRDPLSAIALDIGFADQSHFSNTFRQMVGLTPRHFRSRFGGFRRDSTVAR